MAETRRSRFFSPFDALLAVAFLFAGLVLLTVYWVGWPRTLAGWIILPFFAFFVMIVIEIVYWGIRSTIYAKTPLGRLRESVRRRTEGEQLSYLRISYLMLEIVILMALTAALTALSIYVLEWFDWPVKQWIAGFPWSGN